MTEQENFERIEKLNAELAKSDLPYHTAETERIQAERAGEQAAEEKESVEQESSPAE